MTEAELRQLDGEVYRKVLGGQNVSGVVIPAYSTDSFAAWTVVEVLTGRGLYAEICSPSGRCKEWVVWFEQYATTAVDWIKQRGCWRGAGDTFALAVCRAVLEWAERKVEGGGGATAGDLGTANH